jgi:hypothetical protein
LGFQLCKCRTSKARDNWVKDKKNKRFRTNDSFVGFLLAQL